jgi:hypothetical protein
MVMGKSVLILQCRGNRATSCYLLNKGLSSYVARLVAGVTSNRLVAILQDNDQPN